MTVTTTEPAPLQRGRSGTATGFLGRPTGDAWVRTPGSALYLLRSSSSR